MKIKNLLKAENWWIIILSSIILWMLFKIFTQEADCLPKEWKLNYDKAENSFSRNRIITDYIAGMTDRFAINEHKKLYDFNKGW